MTRKNWYRIILLIFLVVIVVVTIITTFASEINLDLIKLPPGFHISIYAENVNDARSMTLGEKGTLFVGTRTSGNVYAIIDADNNNKADSIVTIARNLDMPNGVAFFSGDLYVAEIDRILVFRNIEDNLDNVLEPEIIYNSYPDNKSHGWKYIAFGPDNKLYIPVGAPCNICESSEDIYAALTRINYDGTGFEIIAKGIRNTVGFDWDPLSGTLWFTDNGRDWMGDNIPPDELNKITEIGQHFGYPYCHGENIPDPEYGKNKSCTEFTSPEINLGPHVAALGMKFYTGNLFPEEYKNQIFIAEHGSWNRTIPIGYRITLVRLKENKAVSYEVFAEGWLQGVIAWGRPVSLLVMPDGSLLVSDDKADAIYRIWYSVQN